MLFAYGQKMRYIIQTIQGLCKRHRSSDVEGTYRDCGKVANAPPRGLF